MNDGKLISRNVLFEMLVLESKGILNLNGRQIIEESCGWGEGACDEELEYRKYLEAYHIFLERCPRYVRDHSHEFGVIQMFEDVDDLINDGVSFRAAVIKMIREKFWFIKNIPIARPPKKWLKEDACSDAGSIQDWMFNGHVDGEGVLMEIVDD